jgi:hypothetical protein
VSISEISYQPLVTDEFSNNNPNLEQRTLRLGYVWGSDEFGNENDYSI